VDKAGHGKTVPDSFSLVSKVDGRKNGYIKTWKSNSLVPLLGTISKNPRNPLRLRGFCISAIRSP
jgi:hypothetical protein